MEVFEGNMEVLAEEVPLILPNGSSKPPPPHVPPRIDPDMYQADVPDWCPENQGKLT